MRRINLGERNIFERKISGIIYSVILLLLIALNIFADPTPVPTQTPNYPAYANLNDETILSFDMYHKLPESMQKDYQLYYMTKVYETNPKFQSLSKDPGWLRDAEWSALHIGQYLGGANVNDGSFWGSCPETAGETETCLTNAKKAFLDKYFPKTPPADANYVPENYQQMSQAPNKFFYWDYTNKPINVSFVGEDTNKNTNPVVHQLVKVYPKGQEYNDKESYAFDPWATGEPEILTWNDAKYGRTYTYSGGKKERKEFIWEFKNKNITIKIDLGLLLPEKLGLLSTNRDNPDDNVDIGRSVFSTGKSLDTSVNYFRLAQKKGLDSVVQVWKQHPEFLIAGNEKNLKVALNPLKLYYNHYASSRALSSTNLLVYDQINMMYKIPEIAIFANGYYENMSGILSDSQIPSTIVGQQDLIQSLSEFKELVIPSGGLQGLSNSEFFKGALDSFVYNGGTLIVFSQPYGDNFLAAPNSQGLVGFGWQQDQSCIWKSTVISNFHPSLASMEGFQPSIHTDGFFTQLGSEMSPVLLRSRNPVPLLVTYKYGKGHVALTTSFSDWSNLYGQANEDDLFLVRDLCLWGLYPDVDMVYGEPESSIAVPVDIINASSNPVTKVIFRIIKYNGANEGSPIEKTVNVAGGTMETITLDLIAPKLPGIYQVDADIYYGDTVEHRYGLTAFASARNFAGKNSVSSDSEITAAIVTNEEKYLPDSDGTAQIQIYNTGTTARTLNLKIQIPYQSGYLFKNGIIVNPSGSAVENINFKVPATAYGNTSIVVWIYEGDDQIGSGSRFISVIQPSLKSANIKVFSSKFEADANDKIDIGVNVAKPYKNSSNDIWGFNIKVIDPDGVIVYSEDFSPDPQPETFRHDTSYQVPAAPKFGTYTITCSGSFGEVEAGNTILISVAPGFRAYLTAKDNNLVGIAGKDLLLEGKIKNSSDSTFNGNISLQIPDLSLEINEAIQIDGNGELVKPFTIFLPLGSPAGAHKVIFKVERNDGAKVERSLYFTIPKEKIIVDVKKKAINSGENLDVQLTNTGGVVFGSCDCEFRLAGMGVVAITGAQTVANIAPGETQSFAFSVPEYLVSGLYSLRINYAASSESTEEKFFNIDIAGKDSTISASTDKHTYTTAEQVALTANYAYGGATLPDGYLKFAVYDNSGEMPIYGNRESLKPDAVKATCSSDGKTAVYGSSMGVKIYDSNNSYICGFGDRYLGEERIMSGDIAFNSSNQLVVLNTATNKVSIYNIGTNATLLSSWDLRSPVTTPAVGITIDSGGKYYILHSLSGSDAFIEIYSALGVFEKQIGSYGKSLGQYLLPTNISLDENGNILVCDSSMMKVVKSDTDGNTLATFDCGGKIPAGAVGIGGKVYVLIEEASATVATKYINIFDSNGNYLNKFSSYLARGRDMAYLSSPGESLVILDAYSIYGADLNYYTTAGAFQKDLPGLKTLSGIVALADGRIWASDAGAGMVWKVSKQNGLSEFISGDEYGSLGGLSVKNFTVPNDIAIDSQNNIYIPDVPNMCVKIFNSSGVLVNMLPSITKDSTGDKLPVYDSQPSKIFIDKNDYVYIYFNTESRFSKFSKDGVFQKSFTILNPPASYTINDFTVDHEGNVWITDLTKVSVYSSDGALINNFPQYRLAYSLTTDSDGDVCFFSSLMSAFMKIDKSGNIIMALNKGYSGNSAVAGFSVSAISYANKSLYCGLSSQSGFSDIEIAPPYEEIIDIGGASAGVANRTLNASEYVGQRIFTATLYNKLNQVLSKDSEPFFVSDDAVIAHVYTDKEYYTLNKDVAQVSMSVVNKSGFMINDTLKLKLLNELGETILWQQPLKLENNGEFEFTIPYPVKDLMGIFLLSYYGYEGKAEYSAMLPNVIMDLSVPEKVSKAPFEAVVILDNYQPIEAYGTLTVSTSSGGKTISVNIPPHTKLSYPFEVSVEQDDSVVAQLTGSMGGNVQKAVLMAAQINIDVKAPLIAPEGDVKIDYIINNQGTIDVDFPIGFTAGGKSKTVYISVPASTQVSGDVLLDLAPGSYQLKYNSLYGSGAKSISIGGPEFALSGGVSLSPLEKSGEKAKPKLKLSNNIGIVEAGKDVEASFTVKNISSIPGDAEIIFRMPGVYEYKSNAYFDGGEQKDISYKVGIPQDMITKDYPIEIIINGKAYSFTYSVQGIGLIASATLNKQIYQNEETAILSVKITNSDKAIDELSVGVTYSNYVSSQIINLAANETTTVEFSIPIGESGNVAAQINSSDGRALFIDTLYLNVGKHISVSTDKQNYSQYGTVIATVSADIPATVTLWFKTQSETFVFEQPGTKQWTFYLPFLAKGTYYLNYTDQSITDNVAFDVDGAEIVVPKYEITPLIPVNTALIELALYFTPHKTSTTKFVFTVYDELGIKTASWETAGMTFTNDEATSRTFRHEITFVNSGMHCLYYEAIDSFSNINIGSGKIFFDAIAENQPPKITNVFPADGETGVNITSGIMIVFNHNMNKDSAEKAFTIMPQSDVSFIWGSPNILVVMPKDKLKPSAEYKCLIAGSAKDINGNALMDEYQWNFTTSAFVTKNTIEDIIIGRLIYTSETKFSYDINGDGIIDIADIVTWINFFSN